MMTPEEHRQEAARRGEKTGCPICGEWNGYAFTGGYCYCEKHSSNVSGAEAEILDLRRLYANEAFRRANAERAGQAYCKEIGRLRDANARIMKESADARKLLPALVRLREAAEKVVKYWDDPETHLDFAVDDLRARIDELRAIAAAREEGYMSGFATCYREQKDAATRAATEAARKDTTT